MFSGSENLMAPSKRLLMSYIETGNDKFKMAPAKTGCVKDDNYDACKTADIESYGREVLPSRL
jgi:hypothetical protein